MKEMIQKVREDKGGFTLAELLVVVAIIAVLVAIAIPVFTASLNSAKYATDEANARSIYAEMRTDYLASNSKGQSTKFKIEGDATTAGTVTVTDSEGKAQTFEFNGLGKTTFTVGTADKAPFAVIAACDQNDNKEVVFGTK